MDANIELDQSNLLKACQKHASQLKVSENDFRELVLFITSNEDKHCDASTSSVYQDLVLLSGFVESINFSKVFIDTSEFRFFVLHMMKNRKTWLLWLCYQLADMEVSVTHPSDNKMNLAKHLFIPLSNYLGIGYFKSHFEEWVFKHSRPKIHEYMKHQLSVIEADRQCFMDRVKQDLHTTISKVIPGKFVVHARSKTLVGIFNKMNRKSIRANEVYDHIAFRIILDDVSHCYEAISIVNKMFVPIEGEYNDYINCPKPNGYQSLHTSVRDPKNNTAFEIQIRTETMHQQAEFGFAAHWIYKEKQSSSEKWLNKILKWQPLGQDSTVQEIFEKEKIFIITPRGDVISLPRGSTGIDAAYAIHTDLGHRIKSIIVNGRIRPIASQLEMGDKIKILCSNHSSPSLDWLSHPVAVKSSKAIRCIRKWFHQDVANKEVVTEKKHTNCNLASEEKFKKINEKTHFILDIEGLSHWVYVIAKCCQPTQDDSIVVKVTSKRGLRVHKKNCSELGLCQKRVYNASWKK